MKSPIAVPICCCGDESQNTPQDASDGSALIDIASARVLSFEPSSWSARPNSMPPRYEMTTAANVTNAAMAGIRTCDSFVKRNAVMIANTSVPVIARSQARRRTMVNPSVLQCGGDRRQQAIDVGSVMVNAKPETQAAIAPVDDDMVVLQPLV